MAQPVLKWLTRAAVIPVAVVVYIAIAGVTGFCPNCKSVVDSVVGRQAPLERPQGAATTIQGLMGYTLDAEPVELAKYAGKPMIIEVWRTTCGPCLQQCAIFHGMAAELGGDVQLLAISVDTDPRVVKKFLVNHPSEMVELMAPRETLRAFGDFDAIPTLVFVDAKGNIRGVETGIHSASKLRGRVKELAASATAG